MSDLESRTKAALKQFDSNMSGIFDRASFYDSDLYSQSQYPELSKSQLCLKWTLIGINLGFLIFGIILLSVGSYAANNQLSGLTGNTVPMGVAVLGGFILVLSFVGAFASWKESRILLILYFVFLLLLTLVLFFVGIAVYVERDKLPDLITQGWDYVPSDVRMNLQTVFSCCGLRNYGDTPSTRPCPGENVRSANSTYPYPTTGNSISSQPCLPIFTSNVQSKYLQAGACAVAFAILMMMGMIFVCCLISGIKQKRNEQQMAKMRQQPIEEEKGGNEEEEEEEDDEEEEQQ